MTKQLSTRSGVRIATITADEMADVLQLSTRSGVRIATPHPPRHHHSKTSVDSLGCADRDQLDAAMARIRELLSTRSGVRIATLAANNFDLIPYAVDSLGCADRDHTGKFVITQQPLCRLARVCGSRL